MTDSPDSRRKLFISYSRRDKSRVYPFVNALKSAGVEVWIDRADIDPLDDFPARIREGLASCHALLAWYSRDYAESTYCQKELTAAWICAQRLTRNVLSRIFIVNPEQTVGHIAIGEMARQNYLQFPKEPEQEATTIQLISGRLAALSGDFSAVRGFRTPQWYPYTQHGSTRFVGRLPELWAVHTAIHPVGISEHEHGNLLVQLRGLGGIGKTLLATEYAKRFGAAFQGGIYWLRAYGFDPDKPMGPKERERERRAQLENLAVQHDVVVSRRDFREISRDLRRQLESAGHYLWIVDDLAPGLQPDEVTAWCAPSSNGVTLVTIRAKDYGAIGCAIEIDALTPRAALELLTRERKPQTRGELEDAKWLADDLGRHALALDVAGNFLLKSRDFATLRQELATADSDPLGNLAAGLRGQLPGGHEKSIVATLYKSIQMLGNEGLTLLRVGCELDAGTPVPLSLAELIFMHAFSVSPHNRDTNGTRLKPSTAAQNYLARAMNQAETHCLISLSLAGSGLDSFSLHPLVRYTMNHAEPAERKTPFSREFLRMCADVAIGRVLRKTVESDEKNVWLDWEMAHARHLVQDASDDLEIDLSDWLARLEDERGHYRYALALEHRVLRNWEQRYGHDDARTLSARHNIGSRTAEIGNLREALRLFGELLPDLERVLGRDHRQTLYAREHIAGLTGRAGNNREALRLFKDLLSDEQRVLGPNDRHTLLARGMIAAETGYDGNPDEAVRLYQELLHDEEGLLGPDDTGTLSTRHNVAFWVAETGNYPEALRLHRELLPKRERVLGWHHSDTLVTRRHIAYCTGKIGHVHEALALFRNLLADEQRVLGPDHPNTLKTRNSVAAWTGYAGDAPEAVRLFRELVADEQQVFGPDDPEHRTARENLAYWIAKMGDKPGAVRAYRELLADVERLLGLDHRYIAEISKAITLLEANGHV